MKKKTEEYRKLKNKWYHMKSRCFNKNCERYPRYGGRGITICEDWLIFNNFYYWSINNGYKIGLTIERINNDGNYEPSNCTFIDKDKQLLNTSRTIYLTCFNETKTAQEWIKDPRCKLSIKQIYSRYNYGWPDDRILTEPMEDQIQTAKRLGRSRPLTGFGETKSIGEWLLDKRCEVNKSVLKGRIRLGWSLEDALTFPVENAKTLVTAFGETKLLKDWESDERCRVSKKILASRLQFDWEPEIAITTPQKFIRTKN